MSKQQTSPVSRATLVLKGLGWWGLLVTCATFGGFAVWMGGVEILSLAGVVDSAKERAVPVVFVVHAMAGGVALIAGALQFNRRFGNANPRRHRIMGRTYVGAVWTASIGGLWSAVFFAVDIPARVMLGVVAILWLTATTLAFWYIRQGRVALHEDWTIRSFALSLFFVTFEPWISALESTGLTRAAAYPLGIFLGWFVNLIVAELWIRRLPQSDVGRLRTSLAPNPGLPTNHIAFDGRTRRRREVKDRHRCAGDLARNDIPIPTPAATVPGIDATSGRPTVNALRAS